MSDRKIVSWLGVLLLALFNTACNVPHLVLRQENRSVPVSFNNSQDSTNTGKTPWREFFTDPDLISLIDSALRNNQELNITIQEIQVANNEVLSRTGAYRPSLSLGGGAGVDKVSRYTSKGAADAYTEIKPGTPTPEVLPNTYFGITANWEIDIWRKLRNAKKSAIATYLASSEGRNFQVTNLVAEIATSYYELLAYDNQLDIIKQNLVILNNALSITKQEKEAAKVTELAVRRFEAEVYKTQSLQFDTQQRIVETENHINFLIGRFPQRVQRNSQSFSELNPTRMYPGIPVQLVQNRPDIRQAEWNLQAAKLDVSVARAYFLPSLNLTGFFGVMAYNPLYLVYTPEALVASIAGDLAGPLINKNAITAAYRTASAKQIQTVYNYEKTVLNAYVEVANQLANIDNLGQKYITKSNQVQALTQSTSISLKLFTSARADYMEVLLTQRDVLEARIELIETRVQQLSAQVNAYRALGGGWR